MVNDMVNDTRTELCYLIEGTPGVSVEAGIFIADHLIANGVTVQKWIPVTERLPEPYVDVLVFRNGKIAIDRHEEDGWFAHDFQGRRATHWMPLPEPPKGE